MAVTHKAIVSLFYRRIYGVTDLAARYRLPTDYVEDVLRLRMFGRPIVSHLPKRSRPVQMNIAEVYGEITIH